ncbi:MAG TPA: hypothetical protein DCZ94_09710 [Lentisphaeria bacterium]|nr:MAG: hypothetical protein A2X48_02790 [Lentisphaerae bacterium GWF2_49_21]HBC87218.1 hypothetical protein [Lentisphaeria bacterium]
MSNSKNKSNTWTGTANKIISIFLIVAAVHLLIILFFVWFNAWRFNSGDSEDEKKGKVEGKNYSENEIVKIPNGEVKENKGSKPVDVTGGENPVLEGESSKKEDILPLLEEIIQPPGSLNETKHVVRKIKAENESFETYTVVDGDNLAKIARKKGVSVEELCNSNHLEGDIIKIGQMLSLPATNGSSEAKRLKPHITSSQASPYDYEIYHVKKGNTLGKIAILYNATPEELAKINSIMDPAKLKEGMELKVPRR